MKLKAIILCVGILSFLSHAHAETVKTGDILAEELGCNACHGADGISIDSSIPNLAGQKYKYLKKQIDIFQTDAARSFNDEKIAERHHPMMHDLSTEVTIYQLNRVIHYYSKLDCKVAPTRVVEEIIPEAKRCEICHGGIRTNPFRDSPNLAGQKKEYMQRQLEDMIEGQAHEDDETARFHRLTELMVEGLTQEGLEKAVDYYSAMGCGETQGQ